MTKYTQKYSHQVDAQVIHNTYQFDLKFVLFPSLYKKLRKK